MAPSQPGKSLLAWFKSKWIERAVFFGLVPALVIGSLWLPPISLGIRMFHLDYPLVTSDAGGIVGGSDGAQLTVPAQAVEKRTRMRLDTLTPSDLAKIKPGRPETLATQNLPGDVIVRGPLYRLDVRGKSPSRASLALPLPADLPAVETVDLFGWDGAEWHWLPSHVAAESKTLSAELERVPSLWMVGQSQATPARVGLNIGTSAALPGGSEPDLSFVCLGGLTLDAKGGIVGKPPTAEGLSAFKQARILLSISNRVDGVVRSDLADNLIGDETLRKAHVQNIADLVKSSVYSGVEIAYLGIDPDRRAEFSAFVQELAQALHASSKTLAVHVERPTQGNPAWQTGAYDWQALGQSADLLRIPALLDPTAYAPGGEMDKLLSWATGEVSRRKIDLCVSANAQDVQKDTLKPLSYKQALGLLAQNIAADDADRMLLPGESVTVSVPDLSKAQLRLDENAQVYWFNYQDKTGAAHTIWLETASSVARKLQYVGRYALGGVSLEDTLAEGNDRNIGQVVRAFRENQAPPPPRFAFVWTVEDAAGKTLDQKIMSLNDPRLSWTAPNNPGNYIIRAGLSDDGGKTTLGSVSQVGILVPTPTSTPTPTPTNTPTPTPTPTATPTATPTPKPTAETKPADVPQPVVSAATAGSFGYGIQVDLMSDGDHQRIFNHIKGMGFNWVKQQIEWFRFNPGPGQYDWGAMDRIVAGANANGIHVLFSVVKAPRWARPAGDTDEGPPSDPGTYATFMREMAARYKGRVRAYEIWNEQNLYYEWGGRGGKLNAGRYVALLAAAYNAIKSVDPGAIVISGALTPTGWNDGDIAIDDRTYLEQMYQAGMARYCDAVGAHPSGFNNPPDADWRNYSDPSASFGSKGHPSWFFRGTMESYRNIMLKYGDGGKRIWPTEFGWASVENLGAPPARGYEYANDNSEGEQAQFLVRAYQMGKAWGWVGTMFLWNLNFGPVSGKQDEKAAFGIVRPDWAPRPAYNALRDMPK